VPDYKLTIVKGKDYEKVFAEEIKVGLKVEVREDIVSTLKNNEYIKDHFKLTVKRLNRWWYSVYFDKKCKHESEPLIFGEDYFCRDCRVKLV
jgi:hypothetical protein